MSLGAVQVGMLQALSEHDIVPDLVASTSAGSLNGAVLARYLMLGGTEAEEGSEVLPTARLGTAVTPRRRTTSRPA